MDEKIEPKKVTHLEVREMEIDDLGEVFHLGEALFTPVESPNLYRTWDEYEVAGLFMEEPEACLVAEYDGRIVGFALGTTIEKSHSAWKYGHLIWLGVAPDFQRTGVAEKLFREFREAMEDEGVRMLIVDTEADNDGALRFFKEMGFNNEEEHIYLYLNISAEKQKKKMRKTAPKRSRRKI